MYFDRANYFVTLYLIVSLLAQIILRHGGQYLFYFFYLFFKLELKLKSK